MRQDKEQAEKLKASANDLYGKKDYRAAYQEYTEAIKADNTNAIYYANRAATCLAMQQFMNACTDADKAISLDPTYLKAYTRRAAGMEGLSRWQLAIEAWEKALSLLPQVESELTAADRVLKEQIQAGLMKARANSSKTSKNVVVAVNADDVSKTPWHRAKAEEDALYASNNHMTSGWVMLQAYREFSQAVSTMKQIKVIKGTDGRIGYWGKPDALPDLTNAILRDHRVFHVDSADWFDKYNKQASYEAERFEAWTDVGPRFIMQEAPRRLRTKGWDSLRPSLARTVRCWIMAGFFAHTIKQQLRTAYEFFSQAVELLEWGQKLWHDVPLDAKGVIFEKSFVRGVKRLRLEVMLQRVTDKEDCGYTRKEVATEATAMIEEINDNPPEGKFDPGFILSFWVYPKVEAMAALGWYYMRNGIDATTAESAEAGFSEAFLSYEKASRSLPPDDELAFRYLFVALEALWWSSKPIKEQIPWCTKLIGLSQDVLRFWEMGPCSEDRKKQLAMLMTFRDHIDRGLLSGEYSDETIIKPEIMRAKDKWANSSVIYVKC